MVSGGTRQCRNSAKYGQYCAIHSKGGSSDSASKKSRGTPIEQRRTRTDDVSQSSKIIERVQRVADKMQGSDADSLRVTIETLQAQLDITQAELKNNQASCKKTQASLDGLAKEELARAQVKIQEFQRQLADQKSKYADEVERLNAKLVEITSRYESSNTEHQKFVQRQSELQQRYDICSNDQKKCTADWAALQQERQNINEAMVREREEYEAQLNTLSAQVEQNKTILQAKMTRLGEVTKALEDEQERYVTDIRQRENRIAELENTLAGNKQRADDLAAEVAELRTQVEESARSLTDADAKNKAYMSRTRAEMKEQEEAMVAAHAREMQSVKQSFEERNASLTAMYERVRLELAKAAEERDNNYSSMMAASNDLKLKSDALSRARSDLQSVAKDNLEKRNVLQGEIDKLKAELSAALASASQHEDNVRETQIRIAELTKAFDGAREEIENNKVSHAAALSRTKEAFDRDIASLKTSHGQELDELRKELSQEKQMCTRSHDDLSKLLSTKTEELSAARRQCSADYGSLKKTVENMERAAEQAARDAEEVQRALRMEIARRQEEMNQLTANLETQMDTTERLEDLVAEKDSEIRQMNESFERSMKQKEAEFLALDKQRSELEKRNKSLEEMVMVRTEELAAAQKDLEEKNRAAKRLLERERELAQMSEELKRNEEMLRVETGNHKKTREEANGHIATLEQRESELSALRNAHELLQKRHGDVTQNLEELKTQHGSAMGDYRTCMSEQMALKEAVSTAKTEARDTAVALKQCSVRQGEMVIALKESKTNVAALEQAEQQLRSELSDTQLKMRQLEDRCQRDSEQCSVQRKRIEAEFEEKSNKLNALMNKHLKNARGARQELDAAQSRHQTIVAGHMKTIADHQTTHQQLKERLAELVAQNTAYMEEAERLKQRHGDESAKAADRLREVTKLQQEVQAELDRVKSDFLRQRTELETSAGQCTVSLTARAKEMDVLNRTNAKLQSTIEQLRGEFEAERSRWETKRANMEQRFSEEIRRVAELVKDPKDAARVLKAIANRS